MKKLLLLFFISISIVGAAQPYNNSWIDYNKTYYKFSVGSTGMYRVPLPVLSSTGMGNTPAQHFQLWRNGEEVRIFTSTGTGPLGTGGFLEFWGLANDGKKDLRLYRDPSFQLSDEYSLQTDTAAYFLTINSTSSNLRFTNSINDVAGTTLSPEPYFMNRLKMTYRSQINPGYAAVVGFYVYSSSYDIGEGWSSYDVAPNFHLFYNFTNLNLYSAGPPASFKIAASGNALNTRNIKVKLFNTEVLDAPLPYFQQVKLEANNIPLSVFQSPNFLIVQVENASPIPTDRLVVSNMELSYPSSWNFNNDNKFAFELPATASGNLLVIQNFNFGAQQPVLLDLNTGARYLGDITSTPGQVKFVLPPSADPLRKFVLSSQDGLAVKQVNSLVQRNFKNFSLAGNQADYIIISHNSLFNDGNGVNHVDQYRAYRASATGGSYNAKVYEIDELVDQFAYGIKKHPLAVKDFVQFAKNNFAQRPKFLFIIGKGLVYTDYRKTENRPLAERLNLVPTYGSPASDNLLASPYGAYVPDVPVGRLSAVSGTEVGNYLDKMKQFESAQSATSQTVTDKAWMKNAIHVIGGKDSAESGLFHNYMSVYERIIEDTLYGGHVETFAKSSTAAIQVAANERIEDLFQEGLSIVSYFGHSSANSLEFNLSSPENYNNLGKYPFFNVSGCTAGNLFIYDSLRLSGNMSLSEKYVLAPLRGSIGFLASTHLGIPPFLHNYNIQFYKAIGKNLYGRSVGEQVKQVIQDLASNSVTLDYYTRMHVEEITLHGDPALKLNPHSAPDYIIEEPMVKISPSIISVADNSFNIGVNMLNIGKAINDSMRVIIKRILPNDSIIILYNQLIPAIRYSDSINLVALINPITDKGRNRIVVTLDVNNRVPEISEMNNTVTKEFFIFEDEIRPVYPYNYSIMNQQVINYFGSTANPLTSIKTIALEIDTTEFFNSPFKKVFSSSSIGGLIQFTPAIAYADNTVYYWRMAMVPQSGNYIWNNSSFVYLANSTKGFNQSHYFQHLKSSYTNMNLQTDRKFSFNAVPRSLTIRTGLYPFYDYDVINVNIDFQQIDLYGCRYHCLQFYVFDSTTLDAWDNYNVTPSSGRFGSWPVCQEATRKFFEFPYDLPAYRKKAMDFLDSIPVGKYVSISNIGWMTNTSFINQWKNDTLTLGPGNSIYHRLRALGFTQIDSFVTNKPFLFFYKKGVPAYTPFQKMGATADEYINETFTLSTKYKEGKILSPAFGPAKSWKELHWRGSDIEPAFPDSVSVEVHGLTTTGASILLATVRPGRDTSLSFIDASVYPYLRLKMNNRDNIFASAHQLNYWRINADYVPEGAIAPNISFKMKDSVDVGEKIDFAVAFKNISETAFDSLKVKFTITDRNNIPRPIAIPRRKALQSGDTLMVTYSIDTRNFAGMNTLYFDVNPDNDQPE
ncbi:MAG: C25 family cysteine peptidase, partial [Chitinophagaceae bacterium]